MAYSESLAERVRVQLTRTRNIAEKKMFGGVAFLLNGNMAVGVNKEDLIVRVDQEKHAALLKKPHTRTFDLAGGRPMQGWLLVSPTGVNTEARLRAWIELGIEFAKSLPKK